MIPLIWYRDMQRLPIFFFFLVQSQLGSDLLDYYYIIVEKSIQNIDQSDIKNKTTIPKKYY